MEKKKKSKHARHDLFRKCLTKEYGGFTHGKGIVKTQLWVLQTPRRSQYVNPVNIFYFNKQMTITSTQTMNEVGKGKYAKTLVVEISVWEHDGRT